MASGFLSTLRFDKLTIIDMRRHRLIIGTILSFIGVVFVLILIRIYARYDGVTVEIWQQTVYTLMVALALLQLTSGLTLMFDRPCPQKLHIFVAAFNLVIFPIGTFAGTYYFWYLLRKTENQSIVKLRPTIEEKPEQ